MIGLIECEIDRDLTERAEFKTTEQSNEELGEEQDEAVYNEEIVDGEDEELEEESEDEELSEDEEETKGLTMGGM